MYQHGYFDQAAESFEQVIAAKPDNADAYYNLGTLNLRRKNYDQARQYLEQTLKLRPDYPEAWNNLGMMAAQQGRPDEAIQDFQQSLAQRPTYATAYLNLGNVYRRQKAFDKAQESLTRALALQPDDPEINYSLGMLYAQQNQMQPALGLFAARRRTAARLRRGAQQPGHCLCSPAGLLEGGRTIQVRNSCRTEVRPVLSQPGASLCHARRQGKSQSGTAANCCAWQPDNAGAKQAMEMLQ